MGGTIFLIINSRFNAYATLIFVRFCHVDVIYSRQNWEVLGEASTPLVAVLKHSIAQHIPRSGNPPTQHSQPHALATIARQSVATLEMWSYTATFGRAQYVLFCPLGALLQLDTSRANDGAAAVQLLRNCQSTWLGVAERCSNALLDPVAMHLPTRAPRQHQRAS